MGLLPDGLLEIMQCPACHGRLEERTDPPHLRCLDCGLGYPIHGDIPVMLEEEALPPEK